jgi:hypothetical protein
MGVSVGFKIHTGWTAYVAVTAAPNALQILVRGRTALLPDDDSIPRFVYHEAAERDAGKASEIVRAAERAARKLAGEAVTNLIAQLLSKNAVLRACGIITASAKLKPQTPLSAILQSHPLIHSAEGLLFQSAVIEACERGGLTVTTVRERDVWGAAATALGCDAQTLRKQIDALRKTAGSPWTADEKVATAAALAAQLAPQ